METTRFTEFRQKVTDSCARVIVGKNEEIFDVIVCLICSGHVLLEDTPGTGKTMLLRAFARTTGGSFKRIQFTPDVLPSDLTGINFFNQKIGDFEFREGPLFANMVLADEINRATPRTQSALLEAMSERQVSVDGKTYPMAEPFMIMATQNPLESHGTFPLPDAQMDRFFMRLSMGYMTREQELSVLNGRSTEDILKELTPVTSAEEIAELKRTFTEVEMSPECSWYIMDVVTKTRNDSRISIGVSTRGAIAWYRASQAVAALEGREFVTPDDIKRIAPSVLAHRLTLAGIADTGEDIRIIQDILENTPVPVEAV